jgi:hypothetical protein
VKRKPKILVDKIRWRAGKITLRPDDILVAKTDLFLDKEQVIIMRERLVDQSGHKRVMLLTGGLDLAVLRKEKLR